MLPLLILRAMVKRANPFRGVVSAREYWRLRRYPRFREGVATVFGQPLRFSDSLGLLHSLHEIFVDEVYRFDSADPAPRIVDAGANIGLSVLYFKRRFPGARIIAFEPDAAIFALLRANTAGLADVELHQSAAWTGPGELSFWSEGSLAGSSEVDFAGNGRKVTVRAERLRDVIAAAPVAFLKIDIEGAENSVLPDIADALDGVDNLFFEYHSAAGQPQQMHRLIEIAHDAGFRLAINGTHGPSHPFIERIEHGFDLQFNAMCYRPRQQA